jgi:mannose-1-phosphate guanylyltransferase/mannose-6-phosphate isomerase
MAMSKKIIPVLLAGGAGSRLWPVSRDDLPKQFQPLVGNYSTYQQTLIRVSDKDVYASPVVITNDAFRFFAKRQSEAVKNTGDIVLEPARRDSAAAVAVAAVVAERREPGSLVLALAADHVVLDEDRFTDAVKLGCEAALAGKIVVFGLEPTEPKTSYGYINPGEKIGGHDDLAIVEAFVEKPNTQVALEYLQKGYLWNSGNFLFRSDVMISEFEAYAPEILSAARASVEKAETDLGFIRLDQESFEQSPKNSIDYAVIEKTKKMAVVTGRFRWSDIGAWDAIWEVLPQDGAKNAVQGNGIALKSSGCLIHSEGIYTAVVGAENLVVVSTPDAVMVVPKSRVQDVKGLVDAMKADDIFVAERNRLMHRPWGTVDSLVADARFAVKHITVDCGGILSLQKHVHRAEHWIVVSGTATVTIDGETHMVTENESVYVPVGAVHRIANEGQIPLEIIEVRTGAYIGEDDVIRIEDVYARV